MSGPEWQGARTYRRNRKPQAGDVIPFAHALWRVISVPDHADFAEGFTITLLSVEHGVGEQRYAELCVHPGGWTADFARLPSSQQKPWSLRHYPDPERYPICSCCLGPIPCRALIAAQTAASEADRAERASRRAEMGACAACGEPVSQRQRAIAFEGPHLDAILSPSPVFHLRTQCFHQAFMYERRWVAAAPGRRWRIGCPGKGLWHVDGWDCTEGDVCPGVIAVHLDRFECQDARCLRCKDARARGERPVAAPWRSRRRRQPKPRAPQGYVTPAGRLGAVVHVTDPARQYSPKAVRPKGRVVVAQYPAGTVLGHTLCDLEMAAEDLWVPYRADPVADGSLCGACGKRAGVAMEQREAS